MVVLSNSTHDEIHLLTGNKKIKVLRIENTKVFNMYKGN